jgi:hypothetical protein
MNRSDLVLREFQMAGSAARIATAKQNIVGPQVQIRSWGARVTERIKPITQDIAETMAMEESVGRSGGRRRGIVD